MIMKNEKFPTFAWTINYVLVCLNTLYVFVRYLCERILTTEAYTNISDTYVIHDIAALYGGLYTVPVAVKT